MDTSEPSNPSNPDNPAPQPEFSVRPATTEDVPRVVEIENRVHRAPWTDGNFLSELLKPYSHFLLFTDDETDTQIAGYLVCWVMFDECQILNLAVDTPFRGMGFAKNLVRKAVSLAMKKEIKKVVLEVRKSNLAAIQLYQGLQFTITHVRKGFYGDGEDAYQMTLLLEGDLVDF
jgi:ribosomal-protein-alanine N-acetyltransferase